MYFRSAICTNAFGEVFYNYNILRQDWMNMCTRTYVFETGQKKCIYICFYEIDMCDVRVHVDYQLFENIIIYTENVD